MTDFDALPSGTRKEVERLAKQGHRHPDPDVAAAATVWANKRLHAGRFGRVIAVILDVALGGGAMIGTLIAQRRLAKRIVKLERSAPPSL
jgi:hypothetical protein